MSIPEWFYNEQENNDIWQPPIDYQQIDKNINALELGIKQGWNETKVQQFLKDKKEIFDGLFRHGHGTFVMYELSFGGTYRADWVFANGHSGGLDWKLVELECPQSKPFKKDGNFSEATRKGIEQIEDWRDWIEFNISYVQTPKASLGLGLWGLTRNAKGIVVVGRRELYQSEEGVSRYNRRRNSRRTEGSGIEIISYETLIDRMRLRVNQQIA